MYVCNIYSIYIDDAFRLYKATGLFDLYSRPFSLTEDRREDTFASRQPLQLRRPLKVVKGAPSFGFEFTSKACKNMLNYVSVSKLCSELNMSLASNYAKHTLILTAVTAI